jgi:hypothetical protein
LGRKVTSADSHGQNQQFMDGLIDDEAADSLFGGLGDNWFVVGDAEGRTNVTNTARFNAVFSDVGRAFAV